MLLFVSTGSDRDLEPSTTVSGKEAPDDHTQWYSKIGTGGGRDSLHVYAAQPTLPLAPVAGVSSLPHEGIEIVADAH